MWASQALRPPVFTLDGSEAPAPGSVRAGPHAFPGPHTLWGRAPSFSQPFLVGKAEATFWCCSDSLTQANEKLRKDRCVPIAPLLLCTQRHV